MYVCIQICIYIYGPDTPRQGWDLLFIERRESLFERQTLRPAGLGIRV